MVFLLEEIVVEAGAIIATLVAAGLLVLVLLGFVLEHRARRASAPAVRLLVHRQPVGGAEHQARPLSTFTPSHD
jgi:hypothetical protein